MSSTDRQTVVVTGYAKAPQGTSLYELYKATGVVLEIDPETDVIVDAEVIFLTALARRFLRELIVGYNLRQGLTPLNELLSSRYLAPSAQALQVAIRVAVQRYKDSLGRSELAV